MKAYSNALKYTCCIFLFSEYIKGRGVQNTDFKIPESTDA